MRKVRARTQWGMGVKFLSSWCVRANCMTPYIERDVIAFDLIERTFAVKKPMAECSIIVLNTFSMLICNAARVW